jgi:hypothetical protein
MAASKAKIRRRLVGLEKDELTYQIGKLCDACYLRVKHSAPVYENSDAWEQIFTDLYLD